MVLEYFSLKRNKKEDKAADHDDPNKTPILKQEDEDFLHRLAALAPPPPHHAQPSVILDNGQEIKGDDAQAALMAGADSVPLPTSPPEVEESSEVTPGGENKSKEEKQTRRRSFMSYLPTIPGRASHKLSKDSKGKERAADDLQSAAESLRTDEDAKKDEEDLTAVLDQLNLSAVNNRVFSFSKESQELMDKFTQVLKDIVNGVPTAYDDLEKLLTHSEGQLNKMFGDMPPFIQTLVKSLPSKMTSSLAPELLAAAAEKPRPKAAGTASTTAEGETSTEGGAGKKKRRRIPSLRSLVTEKGAVAGMLRSILSFLKLRFPAFVSGTNVLMSLAVFVLLFVFWYCHKRGKETRLEREAAAKGSASSDIEVSDMEDSAVLEKPEDKEKSAAEEPEKADGEAQSKPETGDSKAIEEGSGLKAEDMPSVRDLPDPKSVPASERADKGEQIPIREQVKS